MFDETRGIQRISAWEATSAAGLEISCSWHWSETSGGAVRGWAVGPSKVQHVAPNEGNTSQGADCGVQPGLPVACLLSASHWCFCGSDRLCLVYFMLLNFIYGAMWFIRLETHLPSNSVCTLQFFVQKCVLPHRFGRLTFFSGSYWKIWKV